MWIIERTAPDPEGPRGEAGTKQVVYLTRRRGDAEKGWAGNPRKRSPSCARIGKLKQAPPKQSELRSDGQGRALSHNTATRRRDALIANDGIAFSCPSAVPSVRGSGAPSSHPSFQRMAAASPCALMRFTM